MSKCSLKGCDGPLYVAGFCSRHYNRLRRTGVLQDGPKARATLAERIWRYIDKRSPNECWPWVGKSRVTGYGSIGGGGRGAPRMLAHRAIWELTYGPIPDGRGHHGTVVMHTCDNRLCCNPGHLALGSQGENVRDMDAKGRRKTVTRRGIEHERARLTDADVQFIRKSGLSCRELSRKFGMSYQNVWYILKRKTWTHLP